MPGAEVAPVTPRRVLVTGARGQLASALLQEYAGRAEVKGRSREELDITDADAVSACVRADRPDLILNCAAYNDVERAEDDAPGALNVNAFAVRVLARAAAEAGATLVHYSTDFVFDGETTTPYTEEDAPNPRSVYAQSKLLGEWFALEAPGAYVLRVESLFGGAAARSSIDRIVKAIADGDEARVFVDRFVSPSYVVDVSAATRALVEADAPGLYHCVNGGLASWLGVAQEIARILGRAETARLIPVPVADVVLRASRPRFAALSNAKLQRLVQMPEWQDALRRYLA
jgi:dTDP-4-dehydrorhamnose reductase